MSDHPLNVTLEATQAEVGASFRGRAVHRGWDGGPLDESRSRVRGVRVELRYQTEGRGTTARDTVATIELPADDNGNVGATFELPVPSTGPISYDGKLIRVLWEVKATVDVKHRRDAHVEVPVLVVPRNGFGLYPRAHPLRHRADR